MTSLFNGIFKPAGTLPLASLFSQNSKFRAVQAAGQSGSEFAQAEQDKLTIAADVGSKIASKTRKASKKRKHSTVEAQETARTEKVAEPGSHTEPVTKKASTKRIASSDAQKSAAAPVTQQELPDKLAVKPKNKKHKPAADTAGNVVATTTRMPASKLPRKQNKALKAIIDDSTGQPLYSGAAIQSNGNSELAHTGDQADADTQDLADEQATLQRLSPEEQAERLRRTIFVGNISAGMPRKAIRKEFSQYGGVESVRMRSVPVKLDAKMSRRAAITTGNISKERGTSHAYVVFQKEDSAVAALASNMHVLDELHIRVDRAGQSAHGSAGGNVVYERNRTVFVGNLPFDVEDEELITFFNTNCTKLGIPDPVIAVRVVRDSASQLGKGFGFVQFSSQQAARAALGCDGQLLRKRPVRVTKAMKVSANLKQLGQKKPGHKQDGRPGRDSSASSIAPDTGVRQPRPDNKAVAALRKKSQPAENWQGFKTKGSKKTTASAAVKNANAGQRPVAGKRKAPEKRASVAARKHKSMSTKG